MLPHNEEYQQNYSVGKEGTTYVCNIQAQYSRDGGSISVYTHLTHHTPSPFPICGEQNPVFYTNRFSSFKSLTPSSQVDKLAPLTTHAYTLVLLQNSPVAPLCPYMARGG